MSSLDLRTSSLTGARWSAKSKLAAVIVAAVSAAAPLLSGCNTEAYCFANCNTGSTGTEMGTTSSGNGGSGGFMASASSGFSQSSTSGTSMCMQTNGGIEICDGVDNDCNGTVDDIPGIDYTDPHTCGICSNNCYLALQNVDPASVMCAASTNPGTLPGKCSGACAQDYFDLNGDGNCEYYCVKSANDDSLCNFKDDDCDGSIDEDVDLCTSTTDCGKCGGNCVVPHGTPACVHTGTGACDTSNTQCEIAACDPGWIDLDQSYATGCEYQCTPSNGGVEICGDGIDNDCDGKIDGADDLSGDPSIGVPCWGLGPAPGFTTNQAQAVGECGTNAHAGVTQCVGDQVACTGPNVIHQGEVAETCNLKDDNCDGTVDNNPTDAGMACGTSNIFPCKLGTQQCQNGMLVCVGKIDPGTETCNGQDDDCDGTIDKHNGMDPMDSMGACNLPAFGSPPNPGTCEQAGTCTSPCHAGTKSCTGGTIACNMSATPAPGAQDTCGVDANCNGTLENQPNKMTDVHNCGTCGNDCTTGAVFANWSCQAGSCHFDGCLPGHYDLNNDQKCEYACNPTGQEICDGFDNNCNGQIDEGVVAPSPVQVCGVSPAASTPECKSTANGGQIQVQCVAGNWQCTFPTGVCSPSCAMATETCDGLDNDCDGFVNENVPNYGKPCASDDGQPPPGDGACRTFGTYVCNGGSATKCSATKASCTTLPGGCTEKCDGVDNDCDGLVDEPYNSKGPTTGSPPGNQNWYKPNVTKINTNLWVMSFEASRPSATNVIPGQGNGYWTSAPSGTTLDKTPACSEATKIPWFNVTPDEVEQTCAAMGGVVCSTTEWQTGCQATIPCTWGYAPRGAACTSSYTGTKFCNLGPSYDFSGSLPGDQDGLLPTSSSNLLNCYGDWTGLQGNTATTGKLFDMTGNLREIVKQGVGQYKLMGGAFNTASENGAACGFTFYTVGTQFKFYDTGFRCCFDNNPTL